MNIWRELQKIRDELTARRRTRPVTRMQVRLARTVDDGNYPSGSEGSPATPGQTYPVIFRNQDESERQLVVRTTATNHGTMWMPPGSQVLVTLFQGEWIFSTACCTGGGVSPTGCTCVDEKGICWIGLKIRGVRQAPRLLDPNDPNSTWTPTAHGVCEECGSWNRTWYLPFVPGTDTGSTCEFAIQQNGRGYNETYDDNACFPCHAVGHKAAIVLNITCLSNCQISADAVIWSPNKDNSAPCQMAFFNWLPYDPTLNPLKDADSTCDVVHGWMCNYPTGPGPNGRSPFGCSNPGLTPEDPCYQPDGICCDALEGWPCTTDNDPSEYPDYFGCLWDFHQPPQLQFGKCWETRPTNPNECDVCNNVGFELRSTDWTTEVNAAYLIGQEPTAIDNNVHDIGVPSGAPDLSYVQRAWSLASATQIECDYDVLVRYWHPDGVSANDYGYFRQVKSGVPDVSLELAPATDSLDGPHNNTTFQGENYYLAGTIRSAGDPAAPETFQVEGPAAVGTKVRLDHVVLRRK